MAKNGFRGDTELVMPTGGNLKNNTQPFSYPRNVRSKH